MTQVGTVNAKHGLHLRRQPNAQSHVEDTLPYGAIVDIDHQDGNWLLVRHGVTAGYLYKDYVTVGGVSPVEPPNTWTKTIVALTVAIIAAIVAFTYGSLGWRP